MKENKNITIHIGHQKTASTWMQNRIFPKIKDLVYLNKFDDFKRFFYENFIHINPFSYDPKAMKNKFYDILNNFESNKEKNFLFSEEIMTGDFLEPKLFSPRDIFERLKSLEFKFQIIIIIRNQKSILDSLYKEYLQLGGSCNLNGFLFEESTSCLLENLNYYGIIKSYIDHFGKKNVFVDTYENLVKNRNQYIVDLANFILRRDNRRIEEVGLCEEDLSVRANVGNSKKYFAVLRFLNIISKTRKNPNSLKRFPKHYGSRLINYFSKRSKKYSLNNEASQTISDFSKRYAKTNLKLEKLMPNLHLKEKDYPFPK